MSTTFTGQQPTGGSGQAPMPGNTVHRTVVADPAFLGGVYVEMENAWRDMRFGPLFEHWMERLVEIHMGYFEREEDPAGDSWPPHQYSTIRQKQRDPWAVGGHVTKLIESGRLIQALLFDNSDALQEIDEGGAGSHLSYGLDYQFAQEYPMFLAAGYTTSPDNALGVTEKKWDFVGINDEIVDQFVEDVADWAVESLRG